MKKRIVNENSIHNQTTRRRAGEYGPALDKEGSPWSDDDMDKLLDLYFAGVPFVARPGRPGLERALGRSSHAIQTQLWKTFVRYPKRLSACQYEPGTRTPRAGEVLTARDCTACALMFSKEGFKNCAANYQWASHILGRSPQEVYGILRAIVVRHYNGKDSLDDGGAPEELSKEWCLVVHKFCKAKAERLEKEG